MLVFAKAKLSNPKLTTIIVNKGRWRRSRTNMYHSQSRSGHIIAIHLSIEDDKMTTQTIAIADVYHISKANSKSTAYLTIVSRSVRRHTGCTRPQSHREHQPF